MTTKNLFLFIVIIIIINIIFIVKYLDINKYKNYNQNKIFNTQQKINYNHFQDFLNSSTNTNINNAINTKYKLLSNNYENINTIILFYKTNCPYSQLLLPIWYQVLQQLPTENNLIIKEYDCDIFKNICNKYNITQLPTILLQKNNYITKFDTEFTLDNLIYFLQSNQIYLLKNINNTQNNKYSFIPKQIENFQSNQNNNLNLKLNIKNNIQQKLLELQHTNQEQITSEDINKQLFKDKCSVVSFDTFIEPNNKTSHYQIFDSQGQYGYSYGGQNQFLTPFQAAYNVIDTYLSTLPNDTDNQNIDICANLYKNDIRKFGLCNSIELQNIENETNQIINGNRILPKGISKNDYKNKNNIIKAIKKACSI